MFNMFKKSDRRALKEEIAKRTYLMRKAMARYGINSSQAREFDKQINELEFKLQMA